MPFYLRKSISAGPFRFNLSNSGVGLSVGVRGLRVGTGPRGHYIHAGAHGFYYRASLGRAGQKSTPTPQPVAFPEPQPSPVHATDNVEMKDIESGNVLAMTDARFEDIVSEINRKCQQVRLSSVFGLCSALFAFLVWSVTQDLWLIAIVPPSYLLGCWLDSYRRTTVLFYNLEPSLAGLYQKFVAAFETMAACRKTWHVSSGGQVRDVTTWKRNAGADYLVKRNSTTLSLKLPPVVRCNFDVPHLNVGKQDLYFFPDFLLVLSGSKAGAVTYDRLRLRVQPSRHIETESIPSDAQVVAYTWQHPNKKGGPDRRFASNRQIPVCLYEAVHLSSQNGLNELIEHSKTGVAESFASLVEELARYGPVEPMENVRALPAPTQAGNDLEASAARSRWAAAAVVAILGIAAASGLVWQKRESAEVTPAIVKSQAPDEKSAETKPMVAKQPTNHLTTGTVGTEAKRHVEQSASSLDVVITISIQGGNKPAIIGRTNLPAGMELMVSLRRNESAYFAQAKAAVANGQFQAGPFSQKGVPLNPGRYLIEVSSPLATLQPVSVRTIIGQKGENLRGFATRVAFGEKVVAFSQDIAVGGADAPVKDAKARAQDEKDRHAWWLESCKSNCALAQRVAVSRKEPFDWSRCYLQCLTEEPKN
jgi:hypothetical protein